MPMLPRLNCTHLNYYKNKIPKIYFSNSILIKPKYPSSQNYRLVSLKDFQYYIETFFYIIIHLENNWIFVPALRRFHADDHVSFRRYLIQCFYIHKPHTRTIHIFNHLINTFSIRLFSLNFITSMRVEVVRCRMWIINFEILYFESHPTLQVFLKIADLILGFIRHDDIQYNLILTAVNFIGISNTAK